MELLILGLIIIFVLVIQLYIMKKEQEGYVSSAQKVRNTAERTFLKGQDKYWDIRSQGPGAGLVVSKPGMNDWYKLTDNKELKRFTPEIALNQSNIDKGVTNCRALTKCTGLGNNNCGYCAFDKEFRYGTKNGPTANVCPTGAWTTDAKKCEELREKEICANVKSCGDLYGEAEKLCGYCPTTGKSMVMKKAGSKYIPKYADDTCSGAGFGLLPGDKCGKFLKDHPCITPYYLSGPHSADCVKKLWKNSGCTDSKPYGKTYEALGQSIKMPYKQVGSIMQNTNNQTRSTNYELAVASSDQCFGNHNNIKPCDEKYNREGIPHPACLRKEYLEAGCVEKGKGWLELVKNTWSAAKKQVSDANKYSSTLLRKPSVAAKWFGWYEGRYGHPGRGRTTQGQGDCDRDSDCLPGFKCGHDKLTLPGVSQSSTGGWTQCAGEGGRCYGTGQIRYGRYGRYAYKNSTGSIGCNNSTFGDPYWGVYKYCWKKQNTMGYGRDFCYPADNTITAKNYKILMKRISDLSVQADDYPTRLGTSMQCYGVAPAPPPPLKVGDIVRMNRTVKEGSLRLEGIVTRMDGNTCKVLWTKTWKNGVERKRETMTQDDQKKYLGWPGVPPTYNTSLPVEIHKGRLNLKTSCSNDRSKCDMTCTDKVRDAEYRFPRPRDCIVGDWKAWGPCSVKCGPGGIQDRLRPVLYPAKFGGKACPTLKNSRVCNTFPCMNPNFFKK